MFKTYKSKRDVNNPKWGKVLNDIDSHMPAGHIYADADRVTHAHETTHGINSDLRQAFGRSGATFEEASISCEINRKHTAKGRHYFIDVFKHAAGGINAFYCLGDKACIIQEPNVKIQEVARSVPKSLRGGVYDLYLIRQAQSWGDTPLYLCDEWMGYSNGSACGIDLAERGLWGSTPRAETIAYMLEFNVYVLTLAYVIGKSGSYDDKQFQFFVNWNWNRTMLLLQESKKYTAFSSGEHDEYMQRFQKDGGTIYDYAQKFLKNDIPDFGTEEYL